MSHDIAVGSRYVIHEYAGLKDHPLNGAMVLVLEKTSPSAYWCQITGIKLGSTVRVGRKIWAYPKELRGLCMFIGNDNEP